jgi:predicted  nucleic acid-binding Zn-ribbon protein
MGWSSLKQQALKILGDGAEVPDLPDSVEKAIGNWDKAYVAFKAARDDCEKALLETDNANSAHMNALQQFRARLEKNNFKLDDKKDAKKIQQVQKFLTAAIDEGIKSDKTTDKTIDELERHLVQLGKYKQSSSSL